MILVLKLTTIPKIAIFGIVVTKKNKNIRNFFQIFDVIIRSIILIHISCIYVFCIFLILLFSLNY
ncbi:MAG: hypothetical protein DBX38_07380 [Eubacteriales Family XIII. Incertae Sedis bacterium]|nr:MAG: hypothetical protein DBX38_07380 [Clostridiales Family XIII bacterium]